MSHSFFRKADTVGDGSGSKEANIDGPITPVTFKLGLRTGEYKLSVTRLIIGIADTGTFDSGSYGNAVTLTNGIQMGIYDATTNLVKRDLLDGDVIKTLAEWSFECHDMTHHNFGAGDELATVRWTFSNAGKPVIVGSNEYLGVVIRDNLVGLNKHRFKFEGQYLEE